MPLWAIILSIAAPIAVALLSIIILSIIKSKQSHITIPNNNNEKPKIEEKPPEKPKLNTNSGNFVNLNNSHSENSMLK